MKIKFLLIIALSVTVLFGQEKRRIGLLLFENKGDKARYEWVAYGLEYLLLNKLSFLSVFYVPEQTTLKKSLKEAGFYKRPIDERMIYHIGKSANVEVIISGKYSVKGNMLRLQVNYSNAFNGSLILSSTYTESIANLFKVSNKIVGEMVNLAGNGITENERRLLEFQFTNSSRAFESFIKGYMENEKKNSRLEVVIGLFRKAIREDPKFWEAFYNLGITYYNKKSYNEALSQFNKVITALPNFDKPYYGRGLIYEKQKKYSEAIADFKKVTELNPNDHKPYYNLGKISLKQNSFQDAENYLNKAKEINPEYAPIYFQLGNIYYEQDQYRKSINFYKKATELDEENGKYHLKLGDTFYRSQIYYNAYSELKTSISLRPSDPVAYFLLGITVYKQAVLEELIDAFLDLLAGDGQAKGTVEKSFKKKTALDPVKKRSVYEEMADSFTKAAQLKQDFMEATFNLALTYHEMGNTESAEKYYKRSLQIKPNLVRAHLKLAELYTETKRKELAIDQYRKVFKYEPAILVRQKTLGAEHQYINIYQKFRKEVELKLQANPNDPKSNLIMAKVFQAQGQYGKAANILRKVLSYSPKNSEAKNLLAKIQKYGS